MYATADDATADTGVDDDDNDDMAAAAFRCSANVTFPVDHSIAFDREIIVSPFSLTQLQRTKQREQILNFQVPAEGLELVILLYTQY